ncbi:Asp23/Gls24 family envelope stress response protein [Saccharopolyspora sp. NPDC050389]|uniref:Asp23/Gls24 family envelope stress response protein n=1 Tax=Saccharopolyspora sp. NPDC050389 TaxID=3155516 RepID=UPI003404A92B
MTATTGPVTAEEPDRGDDPAERGRLHISRTVLRKIAEHTADQDPGSARRRHRLGGGQHGATAQVFGPDDALRIRLDVALRYPAPVRETVASMRERVGTELQRLTEFRVRTVDVTVSALVPADVPPRVE